MNRHPELLGMSALDDQAAAGAIMWVPGSIIFLIPVAMIIREQLSPQTGTTRSTPSNAAGYRRR